MKYTPCHDGITTYIHWCMIKDQDWPIQDQCQLHKTPIKKKSKTVNFGDGVKLWWDTTMQVDHAVEVNHPNIVLLDRKNKSALLIEVPCPADLNMVKKL
eukprot:11812622-Ditylum_brightwellii.AAC.1